MRCYGHLSAIEDPAVIQSGRAQSGGGVENNSDSRQQVTSYSTVCRPPVRAVSGPCVVDGDRPRLLPEYRASAVGTRRRPHCARKSAVGLAPVVGQVARYEYRHVGGCKSPTRVAGFLGTARRAGFGKDP
jgi:hypothetical protein